MQKGTVILGYARTPFGRFLGAFKDHSAVDLGVCALRAALARVALPAEQIEHVLLGMVVQAGAGQIPSRQVTIRAGLPVTVSSETINKVCASGLRAVTIGDLLIRAGEAKYLLAGGMESMSSVPFLLPRVRQGLKMNDALVRDALINDGLWCPFHQVHMGVHGSAVPAAMGISREAMDRWALRSHQLATAAAASGFFKDEIVPVPVAQKNDQPLNIETDELPRKDTTFEKLAALPPAFTENGLITAGNTPAISDGAAILVIGAAAAAKEAGLEPLAEIIAHGSAALKPDQIATVPFAAAQAALKKAALRVEEIALIEINEAFAAVPLAVMQLGNWPEEKVNINGGAVALGHPIGASGARILITLINALRQRGGGYGLATICSGAAQGEAIIVKVS